MKLFYLFFLLSLPTLACAQLDNVHVTNYALDKIPGEYKGRMTQDKYGYMWIPTADGLYRYDGYELKHYYHVQNDTSSLSFNNVSCVYADKDGSIWAGTFDGGLNHLDPVTGKCKIYKYDRNDEHSISGNRILCIFRDSHNRLWISAGNNEAGLNLFRKQQNNFERIKLGERSLSARQRAANNTINFLNEMKNGDLLASTYDGLWIRDNNTGKFSVYRCDTLTFRLRNNLMGVTLEYPANTIWICTWGGGIKKFDFASKTFETYLWNQSIKNTGFTNIAHDILLKNNNELWLASVDKGFGVFNFSKDEFEFYASSNFNYTTSNYGAYNLCKEKSGNIWIGLDNSTVATLDLNKQPLSFTKISLPASSNYSAPGIGEVVKASTPFQYVVATNWKNGVYIFDERTGNFKECKSFAQISNTYSDLMKDHSGKIWAISEQLYSVDEKNALLIPFKPLIKKQLPSLNEGIEDKNNNFWFTTSDGMIYYDKKSDSVIHYISAQLKLQPSSFLHGLISDNNGKVWAGSDENGLFIFNPSTKNFKNIHGDELPFKTITGFAKDAQGRIWMCGIGGVCVCTDENKYTFRSFSFEDGLAVNNVSSIVFDGKNSIWAIGGGNVSRINTTNFSIYNFSEDIFDNKSIFSISASDSVIYLGCETGFFKFSPADIHYDSTPPPVVINSFKIFDDVYPLHLPTNSINLKYNQNYFSFDFGAITFSDADKCKYAYKLEGFDKDWNYAGNRRYAAYTNIPGGHYTFKVKAANADGVWNNTGVSVPIFITTPFWKTWWFYTLTVVAIILIAYALYRYRINQLMKLQKMRAQIASDLHDDIGSTLTSISFYSEMVKMQLSEKDISLKTILEKMGTNARTMVGAMSDIVWMINPENDVTQNLISKMKAHAAQLLSERNIRYNFHADEFKKLRLNMQQRKNIYLIFKEALHNAIKYSECSEIDIRFVQTEQQINLQLKDNGKGFAMSEELSGNGLNNIKRRAKDLNAEVVIDSEPGAGTNINLYVKIT